MASPNPSSVDSLVAGYRLVRRLGLGSRASVYLGIEPRSPVPGAIKIFHPATAATSIDAELRILTEAPGENMVVLRDLHRGEGTPTVFVFDRLRAPFDALQARLQPGQSSTVLVPVLRTIAHVHDGGVAHGRLRQSSIGVDDHGRPLVLGWGHALRRADEAYDDAVRADTRALAALAHLLSRMSPGPDEQWALTELAGRLDDTADPESLRRLADDLLLAVPPTPVRAGPPADGPSVPALVPAPAAFLRAASTPVDDRAAPMSAVQQSPVRRPLLASIRATMLRVRAMLQVGAPRRARILGIGAVVATATATILLWPGAKSESVPTATTPSYSVPTLAEDPAEATTQLLAARTRCLAEQSALCLQDVDDVTAALFLEDQRRIDGESPAVDLSVFDAPWPSATLSERDGDAALVDVERDDEAASVLLIRTAEGWRLRALLPATSPTL